MIKVVIVDDEVRSRETIREMLKLYCPDTEVVGMGENVRTGIEVIKTHKPDLVMLDIKMPDGLGFDLLRQLMPVDFKLIFITAYEEYAIKAFKFNAVDYITKPVDPVELQAAVERVKKMVETGGMNHRLQQLLDSYLKPATSEGKKFTLRTADTIYVVELDDILRCEATRNYTIFYLKSGEQIMMSKSLREYEDFLVENSFLRVHQSHIINLAHLKRFRKDEFICVLSDDSQVPVAHRKRDELIRALREI